MQLFLCANPLLCKFLEQFVLGALGLLSGGCLPWCSKLEDLALLIPADPLWQHPLCVSFCGCKQLDGGVCWCESL